MIKIPKNTCRIRFAACAFSFSLLTPILYAVQVLDPAAYEEAAKKSWSTLKNMEAFASYARLDQFLSDFPDAEISADIFAVRLGLVQSSGSIADYNDFITRYPERMSTLMAIHEVFEMYDRVGTMGAYLDFLKRYPRTPQADLAKRKAHLIAFELATKSDRLEDYDAFIRLFPEAAQISPVKARALEKRLTEEDELLTGAGMTDRTEKRARANVLAVEFGKEMTKAAEAQDPGEMGLSLDRASRLREVLTERYAEYDAAREVRNENRHGELLKKLDEIDDTLKRNHADLLDALHREFAETRRSIADGVAALKLDNAETRKQLDENFRSLENKADILHRDLGAIQGELVKLNVQFKDVRVGIAATNQKLDQIHVDLNNVHQGLIDISKAIGTGFKQNGGLLAEIRTDIQTQTKALLSGKPAEGDSQAKALNTLFTEKDGQLEKNVANNRGSFTPVKTFLSAVAEIGDTFLDYGLDDAKKVALHSVPGVLADAVGWSLEKIPVAGEFIASPAYELTYALTGEAIDLATTLRPEEIAAISAKAESLIKGSGTVVTGTLAAISLEEDARIQSVSQAMGADLRPELKAFIAGNF